MVHTVIPYMVQQLLLTDRASLVQQQVFQYSELLSGKGQLLPTGRGGTGFGVKGYLPQVRTTSFCVNWRRVRLRIRAANSSK